jgi:hypothetical protein
LLRQSDIGSNAGIVLMNDAKDVDSNWIQFYSANQIIGILLQSRGQCQAHLQHHSCHISHALHVYEVNNGTILDIVNTLSCEDKEW